MRRIHTAFTLIELLVVIAIIAILAAILFPVFARAKMAAKAAASISNAKQIETAITMYTNDYDDDWPLSMAFGESNAQYYVGSMGISPWSYSVLPYMKAAEVYVDPIAGGTNGGSGSNLSVWEAYNAEYGLNWTLLNGGYQNPASPFGIGSEPTTQVSRPSDMVMLTESTLHTDPGYQDWFYNFGFTYGSVLGVVEGPYCNYTMGCSDLSSYWGTSNGYANLPVPASPTQNSAAYLEGAATSGAAMRDNGFVITGFCDGHTKAMTIGALAAGNDLEPDAYQESGSAYGQGFLSMVAVLKTVSFIFTVASLGAALVGCSGGVPSVATQGAVASASTPGISAASEPPSRKKALMSQHMNMESKQNDSAALHAGARLSR